MYHLLHVLWKALVWWWHRVFLLLWFLVHSYMTFNMIEEFQSDQLPQNDMSDQLYVFFIVSFDTSSRCSRSSYPRRRRTVWCVEMMNIPLMSIFMYFRKKDRKIDIYRNIHFLRIFLSFPYLRSSHLMCPSSSLCPTSRMYIFSLLLMASRVGMNRIC